MNFFGDILSQDVRHWLGGKLYAGDKEKTFDNIAPHSDLIVNQVYEGGAGVVEMAVSEAKHALAASQWAKWPVAKRAACLYALADLIETYRADLAKLESIDTGKPLTETFNGDIPRSAMNFRFFAQLAEQQSYRSYLSEDGSQHTSYREPIGIVGLITPWNLPMYLESWKLAPALAMGNAVILKPAELTPLTAFALGFLAKEAGIPDGIVNVVQGYGVGTGSAMVEHPEIKAISFTGETTTGSTIARHAAPFLKKLSFELGGKGASVVFADAKLDEAAQTVCRAAFRNQGQICLAGSRLLIEEKAYDAFMGKVDALVQKIVVGDPLDERTTMGSLISRDHRDKVLSYIHFAKESGCEIRCGGRIPEKQSSGAFLEPTVITGVKQESKLIQEEIFGPVLTVQTFSSVDEASALLNGTPYGLSCSIWTQDEATMAKMTDEARMGLVWQNSWFLRNLNTAFGGMKKSGVGREGGEYSFDFFSEFKTVSTPSYLQK